MAAGFAGRGGGMMSHQPRTAVITGASAGIGEATARALAREGFHVVLGARRVDRIEALAAELGGQAFSLDVTSKDSVAALAACIPQASVLVNNAGLALGLDPLESGSDSDWETVIETNVLGLMRVTRALLPALQRAPHSHIVNLGSVAGWESYKGGSAYCASKHAVRSLSRTLRLELLGRPIRVTEVSPGLVKTEFSLVRFHGDAARAETPYAGLQPLTADDIAECVRWAVMLPPHVNIDEIIVKPVAQASATVVHRAG
ncbi:MAG: putative oxidoreductase [Myxococcota bacterium]|nr:putative oxidoreductase [Myxococcota bacterium]